MRHLELRIGMKILVVALLLAIIIQSITILLARELSVGVNGRKASISGILKQEI
jgi:hypothetical protein